MSGAKFDQEGIRLTVLAGMVKGLAATQVAASRLVKENLSKPGAGRLYRVAKGKAKGRNLRARGYHRASLPGSPPAVNTNRLRASWSVERVWASTSDTITAVYREGSAVTLRFGSNVPYARLLEFGTRRMKKRPYLKPIMPNLASVSLKLIAVQVKVALREAT